MKRYLWGFPGIGKSNLSIPGIRIADADCEVFKYKNVSKEDLHSGKEGRYFEPDPTYPQNYFEYIKTVDADLVLLNCHLTLLNELEKDQILVVYPCNSLDGEYMLRYQSRGDGFSFVKYMAEEWEGMLNYIASADFEKYQIFGRGKYLSNLFERNDFIVKLMTRSELTDQLQRAIDLKVLHINDNTYEIDCDVAFAVDGTFVENYHKADLLAEAVLDGKYSLDVDRLEKVCSQREAIVEQERIALERRGGLSREELEDKIMQGIVNGALSIHHGQIAPYSYGFEVQFQGGGAGLSGKNRWECYCDLFEVPKIIALKIEQNSQNREVFGQYDLPPFDIDAFLSAIESAEGSKITSFTPEKDTDLQRAKNSYTYPYRNSIAGLRDVHMGKGLDGIAKGYFGGDYSSMTTGSQNDLIQTLVFLKGFCLDCLNHLHSVSAKENVIKYLKKHGTDISTPEKLQEWMIANPEKCGKEENRVNRLADRIRLADNKKIESNKNVDQVSRKER